MDTPIFAELDAVPEGAHDGHRRGARPVMDLIRAVEPARDEHAGGVHDHDPEFAERDRVGLVPGVLSFRLPA